MPSKNLIIHDLLNHLHHIQLLCEKEKKTSGREVLRLIQQECESAIYQVSKLQKEKRTKRTSCGDKWSCGDMMDFTRQFLNDREVKLSISSDENIKHYESEISKNDFINILSNLAQNLKDHAHLSADISLRIKVVNGHLLFALKNKIQMKGSTPVTKTYGVGSITDTYGLESIEAICSENGGKLRFLREKCFFYTRLFLPVTPACPIVQERAA